MTRSILPITTGFASGLLAGLLWYLHRDCWPFSIFILVLSICLYQTDRHLEMLTDDLQRILGQEIKQLTDDLERIQGKEDK